MSAAARSAVDAAIVGSGPNGLSAAIALARAGLRVRVHEAEPTIGGGARSVALTLPGFVHDRCSAIHPLAVASPFFRSLPLAAHGLEWIQPPVPFAHPLDDGTAVALHRSVDETADALGGDGPAYRRLVGPFVGPFDKLVGEILRPALHLPRHPLLVARFGALAVAPMTLLARLFRTERAPALLAGGAAHSFLPLSAPFTGAFALVFAVSGHAVGWPLPRGGSQAIADALAAYLRSLGGEIATGERIEGLAQLGPARAYLFDTAPEALARIAGPRLPDGYRRALGRYRPGPGVFKIDYALSAPVPWRAPVCRRAGTVHLGGSLAEIAASERVVARGRHPERPFVLVAQQSLFDPTRAPAGQHTLWAYCHVPNGSIVDMTGPIEAQLERFAPGFREVVLARHVLRPSDLEARNANDVGGDISAGAHDGLQLIARPVWSTDPYATPARELYLCSAATPPGGGVHGMCGANAARSALRRSFSERLEDLER